MTASTPGAAFGLAPSGAVTGPAVQAPNPVRDESHRIERQCDACGQWDDHPRHVHSDPVNGRDVLYHFDCCAARGCPLQGHPDLHDHSCGQVLAAAPDKAKHGAQLVAWLVSDQGKAHTRKINEEAEARKTVRVAREAIERHEWEAEQATANAEHAQSLVQQAQKTLKGGRS